MVTDAKEVAARAVITLFNNLENWGCGELLNFVSKRLKEHETYKTKYVRCL